MPPTGQRPQTHGLFDQQPTHAPSQVHVLSYRHIYSQLSAATAFFFQIDSLQGSRLLVSPPLSHTHTNITNQTEATLSHTQHSSSSCDRPTMSDSTTKLAEKQCYPDTKALRTAAAVGEFFAHDSRSFTASKNSGGKQKTCFCSGKEGGCEAPGPVLYCR